MPSEPVESGSSARIARPASVRSRRARVHGAAERLDHDPAVRLLVVRRPHLPDLALEVELRAGEGQRGAPLAGAGLGGQLRDARLGVVERLRHRGVRLVRAGRRDALVLVVDPGRRAERLLQPVRAEQRRRPPQPVDVEHLARDLDVLLRARPPAGSGPSGTAAPGRPGPTGWPVPGCSTGGGGVGRSCRTLYQRVGISLSSSRNLCCFTSAIALPRLAPAPRTSTLARSYPAPMRVRGSSGSSAPCSSAACP